MAERNTRPAPVIIPALAAAALWLMTPAPAAADELDDALGAVVSFATGADSGPIRRVETAAVEAATDPARRGVVEGKILAALEEAKTPEAKIFLCKQLRVVGTPRSVPVLEPFLTDPEAAHIARYVLARYAYPEAAEALYRALGKTRGEIQAGLLDSLADAGYAPAREDCLRLLRSSDPSVAGAAARGLGLLGGAGSVAALEAARESADRGFLDAINHALLRTAERALAAGETATATRIYRGFYAGGQAPHLRVAGLSGLVSAGGPEAADILSQALRGKDPAAQGAAIRLMTEAGGAGATRTFAALLPTLGAEAQVLVLGALATRGDPGAAPAVTALVKSSDESVRTAALEALGSVGGETEVTTLALAAAGSEGPARSAARASLVRLDRPGVDESLISAVGGGTVPVQVEVLRALAARGVPHVASGVARWTRSPEDEVRKEAIKTLGAIVAEAELPNMVRLLLNPFDEGDRDGLESAIALALRRVDDPGRRAAPLLDAVRGAPAGARPALLRLLGRAGGTGALEVVRGALRDRDEAVRDAAVRSLSAWADPSAADDLLAIANAGAADPTHRVLALRGYVRLAELSDDPDARYARALESARRPEDKKLVLSGLGNAADSPESLALVQGYLDQPELRAEAAAAAVRIAARVAGRDEDRVRFVLSTVAGGEAFDDNLRRQAHGVLNELDKFKGYILAWKIAGPFQINGKDARAVFAEAFPPEQGGGDWTLLKKGVGAWEINFEHALGGRDHAAAYLKTRLWVPAAGEVQLELGSDDAIKVWVNGGLVHQKLTARGIAPRQDIVTAEVKKGWNGLLLKVVNIGGGWAGACRVRDARGGAVTGMKVDPE